MLQAVNLELHSFQAETREFEDFDAKEFKNWLKLQTKNVLKFCPENPDIKNELQNENSLKIIKTPRVCHDHERTRWNGKWDKSGMPKGSGMLLKLSQAEKLDLQQIR